MKSGLKIGILAVQGAFIEHRKMLESLGCECIELRQKSDICDIDGLVLPGGESTVQGKLLRELDMFDVLKDKIANGLPVLATCAGLILLAEHISNDDNVYFGTLPVTVKRNAYGRQLGSFEADTKFDDSFDFTMTFIRAPYVESISNSASDVRVLAEYDGKIVGVQYHNQIGLAFHPELGNDTRIHERFLQIVSDNKAL
ncbi:pyridoxal 5'-phosphate synthase glutaminase subunit PdxT [Agathobacter sp.]